MGNLIKLRNFIIGFLYRHILKKIFFLFDAERTHDFMTATGKLLGKYNFTRKITSIFFFQCLNTLYRYVFIIYENIFFLKIK